MSKRARTWLTALGEVLRALVADPIVLALALGIIGLTALAAYMTWRFI